MVKTFIPILAGYLLIIGCDPSTEINPQIMAIEKAHEKDAFMANTAIQFDINIQSEDNELFNGQITLSTNSEKGQIAFSNGEKILFNHGEVFCSEGLQENPAVRFTAFTWPYLFLFPYKLSDPGTQWEILDPKELHQRDYNIQKLTFAAGTGDTPEDWYLVHSDKETNLIGYAVYIITAGMTRAEAEKEPYAIQYKEYRKIDGVPIAHKWSLWTWSKDIGLTKNLGQAVITNVRFVEDFVPNFSIPDQFIKK